jgi:signal transduction histidine kinase
MLRQPPLNATERERLTLPGALRAPPPRAAMSFRGRSPAIIGDGRWSTVSAESGSPDGSRAGRITTTHTRRAIVRLALLVRVVPLLQAVATMTVGFAADPRPWLNVAAVLLALGWSAQLARTVWPTGRCSRRMCLTDAAIAAAALFAAGAAIPPDRLTTSFYWAGSYVAAVAVMLGMSLPAIVGTVALIALIACYGLVVDVGAGTGALPAAAGNAAGCAAYFGCAVAIAAYVRRLAVVVSQAENEASRREAALGVRQARMDEFGRLHDEAVQVLERVAATGEAGAAALRAYAARSASHLRAAITDPEPLPGSVPDVLRRVAAGFASLGFGVTLDCAMPLPDLGGAALAKLAAAVTESLNNACKHSGADGAAVRAVRARGGIEVSVEDHGTGFATGSVQQGFGVSNCIRRRIEEAGGTAEISSVPGAGTVVRMWLPC